VGGPIRQLYSFLAPTKSRSVLEVGCGPHTNVRFIIPILKPAVVYLEDPLIDAYLFPPRKSRFASRDPRKWRTATRTALQELVESRSFRVELSSAPLESLPYRTSLVDAIVCINVLDHVRDADQCMREVLRVLRPGGVLVLGQDLSNDEDLARCPESWADVGHPIKLDEATLSPYLDRFQPLFSGLLSREAGRNPNAHYATLLFAGTKV
jgi:SAM-dependent methyltransferase